MDTQHARTANELRSNLDPDLCLASELADFEAERKVEDVELMTTEQRQRINAEMARWFGLSVTGCQDEDCDCGGEWNIWE